MLSFHGVDKCIIYITVLFAGIYHVTDAVLFTPTCPVQSNHKCLCNQHKCYVFVKGILNWNDAESTCAAFGGNLLSFSSEKERLYLRQTIAGDVTNWVEFWVGGRKVEHKWRWSHNSEPLASAYIGCYETTPSYFYTDSTPVYLTTNHPDVCVSVCQQYSNIFIQYRYAALTETECTCLASLDGVRELTDSFCGIVCPGDSQTFCGGYGTFSVYDITKSSYMLWSETQVQDPIAHDCVFVERPVLDGLPFLWQTISCTERKRFVCEYPSSSNSTKRYNVSAELRTWYEARLSCHQLNAYLAEPRSVDDYNLLHSALTDHNRYWIGLSRSSVGWTADGSASSQYTGECLSFRDKAVFAWKPCNARLQFVCQLGGDIFRKANLLGTATPPTAVNGMVTLQSGQPARVVIPQFQSVLNLTIPSNLLHPFIVSQLQKMFSDIQNSISDPNVILTTNLPSQEINRVPTLPSHISNPSFPYFPGPVMPTIFIPTYPQTKASSPRRPSPFRTISNGAVTSSNNQLRINLSASNQHLQSTTDSIDLIISKIRNIVSQFQTTSSPRFVNAINSKKLATNNFQPIRSTNIGNNILNIPSNSPMRSSNEMSHLQNRRKIISDAQSKTVQEINLLLKTAEPSRASPSEPSRASPGDGSRSSNVLRLPNIKDAVTQTKNPTQQMNVPIDLDQILPPRLREVILLDMMDQIQRGQQPKIPIQFRKQVLDALSKQPNLKSILSQDFVPLPNVPSTASLPSAKTIKKSSVINLSDIRQPSVQPVLENRVRTTPWENMNLSKSSFIAKDTTTICQDNLTETTVWDSSINSSDWSGPLPLFVGLGIGLPILLIIAILALIATKRRCLEVPRIFHRKLKCRMNYWADNLSHSPSLNGSVADYGPFQYPILYNPDFGQKRFDPNIHPLSIAPLQYPRLSTKRVSTTTPGQTYEGKPRAPPPPVLERKPGNKARQAAMIDVIKGRHHTDVSSHVQVTQRDVAPPPIPPRSAKNDPNNNASDYIIKTDFGKRDSFPGANYIENQLKISRRHDPLGESARDAMNKRLSSSSCENAYDMRGNILNKTLQVTRTNSSDRCSINIPEIVSLQQNAPFHVKAAKIANKLGKKGPPVAPRR